MPWSWIYGLIKITVFPKSIYRVKIIPLTIPDSLLKISNGLCIEVKNLIPEFIGKPKRPRMTKTILKKKKKQS